MITKHIIYQQEVPGEVSDNYVVESYVDGKRVAGASVHLGDLAAFDNENSLLAASLLSHDITFSETDVFETVVGKVKRSFLTRRIIGYVNNQKPVSDNSIKQFIHEYKRLSLVLQQQKQAQAGLR